jgi:hypothetical protein
VLRGTYRGTGITRRKSELGRVDIIPQGDSAVEAGMT